MTRQARSKLLYDGCYAHIFSRSIEKRKIFESDDEFRIFKSLLSRYKTSFFLIHHYCLMQTHFHLVVSILNLGGFSQALKMIKWNYTHIYNERHQRQGPLWENRFHSMLIENETYLYACGLYVEHNPVEAGLVTRREDWPYSSAGYYLKGKNDLLVDSYKMPKE